MSTKQEENKRLKEKNTHTQKTNIQTKKHHQQHQN